MSTGHGDLSKFLRDMTPVRTGMSPREAASSRRMNAIQGAIRSLVRGENIVSGINVRKRSGPDWVALSSNPRLDSVVSSDELPFEVIQISNSDPLGAPLCGVVSNSHLLNSEDRDTYEEDNSTWGLLNDPPYVVDHPGSFTVPNKGEKIWLEIKLDIDQVILSIGIQHGSTAGAWDNYPDPIFINTTDDPDNPYQQYYRQIIAEVTDPEEDPRPGLQIQLGTDKVQITQILEENLMIVTAHTTWDADEPQLPIIVAVPWGTAPGTKIDGSADEIESESDLMTPYSLGAIDDFANTYAFKLSLDSIDGAAAVIHIAYGEVNDLPPDGMTGADNYLASPITVDGTEFWVEVDYDTSSLAITGRSINWGAAVPASTYGALYVPLGNVDLAFDVDGNITKVFPHNRQCGDISIAFIYGAMSGSPALFTLRQYADPVLVT